MLPLGMYSQFQEQAHEARRPSIADLEKEPAVEQAMMRTASSCDE